MNINAKYFGEISYEKEDTIHVVGGLLGFEDYKEFLPLSFYEEDDYMISLQNLEDESLSFILMNPFMAYPEYAPKISGRDLKELEADSVDDISFYAVSVIREPADETTLNLRAPLAVNALNRKAKQIMLEQPEYSFRHTLKELNKKEGV